MSANIASTMKKAGQLMGFGFLIIGGMLTPIGYSMYNDAGFSFKFLLFMPCLALLGLSLILFPGGNITTQQIKSQEKEWKDILAEGPMMHKIMWVLFSAMGFIFYAYRDAIAPLF